MKRYGWFAGLERPISWCDECIKNGKRQRGRYSRKDKQTLCPVCRAETRDKGKERT